MSSISQNLQQVLTDDGVELYINTKTGESFASIRGYSRMAGKDESTIRARIKTTGSAIIKKAEVPTASGLKTAGLIDEDTIFKWLINDNQNLAFKLGKLGVRVALHKWAGFDVNSEATQGDKSETLTPVESITLPSISTSLLIIGSYLMNALS